MKSFPERTNLMLHIQQIKITPIILISRWHYDFISVMVATRRIQLLICKEKFCQKSIKLLKQRLYERYLFKLYFLVLKF